MEIWLSIKRFLSSSSHLRISHTGSKLGEIYVFNPLKKQILLNKIPPAGDMDHENSSRRQLVLNKGAERYIFRYYAGREDELLDVLINAVKDPRTNFDWFDAAVLSFKLTQSLIAQADYLMGEDDWGNKGSISDGIDPTDQSFNPGDFYK